MDNQQAKLILHSFRPGPEDASDPVFAPALDQARRDPELRAWLAHQQHFDQAARAALQSITPPPNLRQTLLQPANLTPPSAPRPARPALLAPWLALSAAILLLLTLTLLLRTDQPDPLTTQTLVQDVVAFKIGGHIRLAKTSSHLPELQTWLAQQGAPADFPVPIPLQPLPTIGCQTLTLHGHTLSLICFRLDQNRIVHFFIIQNSSLTDPPGPQPQLRQIHQRATATWSRDGHTFIAIGEGLDEETLRRLI